MERRIIYPLTLIVYLSLGGFAIFVSSKTTPAAPDSAERQPSPSIPIPSTASSTPAGNTTDPKPAEAQHIPLDRAGLRITKKHFGTFVTPKNSPVSPEKFQGFHTGIDMETFEDEQAVDIAVYAVCDGRIRQTHSINGYGGVLIQDCTLHGEAITVLYGHLRQTSIQKKAGDLLKTGDEIGVLGTGYSLETSGERKHLHLSIHRGSAIDVRGYVQSKTELDAWEDPEPFIVSGN